MNEMAYISALSNMVQTTCGYGDRDTELSFYLFSIHFNLNSHMCLIDFILHSTVLEGPQQECESLLYVEELSGA